MPRSAVATADVHPAVATADVHPAVATADARPAVATADARPAVALLPAPPSTPAAVAAWLGQRAADCALALLLAVPVLALCIVLAVALVAVQGRPVLHCSARAGRGGRVFAMVKFRTMAPGPGAGSGAVPAAGGDRVLGGDGAARVTPLGRWMRRSRADELPQLWHLLTGEMALVGPRPPLPGYALRHGALYAPLLAARPGITGLASVIFAPHEARLLAVARSPDQTEAIYCRRCMPRKARLDMIHARNRSARLDAYILYLTVARFVALPGRRAARVHAQARNAAPGATHRGLPFPPPRLQKIVARGDLPRHP